MDYTVEKLTLSIKLVQKGVECLLCSKEWSRVSFFETKVC